MKLLVTGGAGYIGSIVAATLLASDHEVVVLDDLSTGHAEAVPHGARFIQAGVLAAGEVLDGSFDAVLHFAAKALVAESVAHPEVYWSTNVVGSLNLLCNMRDAGVRRLVFSSTAATYGAPTVSPITEDTPAVPQNPYGQSKLAVDHMLAGEARAHGLGAVSLRYFNVGGSAAGLGEHHDPETHLIPNVLEVAHGRRESVNVYGTDYDTPDGTAIRDYLHVQDLADAHLLALDAAVPGEHAIVNLGTGTGYSVREVIDACRRVTGHPIPHVDRDRRAGDPPILVASGERAKARLGWTPRHDLERIVADAWAFVRR
jgi:UDP-glucose 4-epimerase